MRSLLAVVLLLSTHALAQRIGVVPFTGPNAAAVRNQLVTALCDGADCVNTAKVTTANKPDWKKAKKEALQGFVKGTIAKKGKALVLTLEVLTKAGPPAVKKTFPLEGNALSDKNVQAAVEAVRSSVAGAAAPVEPPPPAAVQPAPQPVAVAPQPTPPPAPKEPAPAPVEPEPTTPARRRIPFIAAELGADVVNRDYSYVQPVTSLRGYRLAVVPLALAKIELYPLALARQDVLGGLGIEASFAFAPWLSSSRQVGEQSIRYPSSTMRIDAGIAWRIMPSKSLNLSLIPIVGMRLHSFTVGRNSDGERLEFLPNLSYLGLRAGAGFEVGLLDDLLFFFGRFTVIPVLSSGEVISSAFFPKGSNLGLDGSAGIGIGLGKLLQLRLAFDFTRYGLSFQTEPTDTFIAQGAVDRYIGGTATLRFQY